MERNRMGSYISRVTNNGVFAAASSAAPSKPPSATNFAGGPVPSWPREPCTLPQRPRNRLLRPTSLAVLCRHGRGSSSLFRSALETAFRDQLPRPSCAIMAARALFQKQERSRQAVKCNRWAFDWYQECSAPVDRCDEPAIIKFLPGSVKVSTGILKVGKLSEADRQTANLNINADNDYELALAA